MTRITRGFHGRRRPDVDPARVPPGQYVTQDFPVLSAGPTPHGSLESWSFTIRGQVDEPHTWTWDEFQALPRETVTRRHPLRDEVVEARHGLDGRLARHAAGRRRDQRRVRDRVQRRRLHDQPAARGPDRRPGLDRVLLRRRAAATPSTAGRPGCWCRISTSGRARSGCAGWSCSWRTSPASGRATATTTTAIRGASSATPAIELAAGHRARADRARPPATKSIVLDVPGWAGTGPASTSTCG